MRILVITSVSKRYIAAAPTRTAELGDITHAGGYFVELRPLAGNSGKPGPLIVLLNDTQILDTHQGGHWLVAAGDDEPFVIVRAFGHDF